MRHPSSVVHDGTISLGDHGLGQELLTLPDRDISVELFFKGPHDELADDARNIGVGEGDVAGDLRSASGRKECFIRDEGTKDGIEIENDKTRADLTDLGGDVAEGEVLAEDVHHLCEGDLRGVRSFLVDFPSAGPGMVHG